MKRPYTFPARSRKAMAAYLLDRRGYSDHYTPFPFSWNVKAHCVNYDRPTGDYTLSPAFDSAWQDEITNSSWRVNSAFEAAQSYYVEEWCSYPGADQGDWRFGFYGRQGGHLCLEMWRGRKMYGGGFDLEDWLEDLPFSDLKAFYRAVVCMDQDFTQKAARQNVEADLNYQRHQWEEDQIDARESAAREFADDLEQSRPDLYAHNVENEARS